MWKLKTAFTWQNPTIEKLLSENWEPFTAINTGQTRNSKPVIKLFFRRNDAKAVKPTTTPDSKQIDNINENVGKILELLTKMTALQEGIEIDLNEAEETEEEEDEEAEIEDELIEEEEEEEAEEEEIPEEEDAEEEENPGNEGNDPLPLPTPRTKEQERIIGTIRKQAKSNITVNPPAANGVVTVIVGDEIFYIDPNGEYTKQ